MIQLLPQVLMILLKCDQSALIVSASNIAALIIYNYFSDRTCSKGQCWCVTNGGNTCQRWDILFHGKFLSNAKCDIDKCVSVADCQFNGYWCDDSQDPGGENQGLY